MNLKAMKVGATTLPFTLPRTNTTVRPDDLKAFIDACHSRGIAVIIDMVLNHSYGQSPLVQLYFDQGSGKVAADNPWYNVESPNPVFAWGYDFNHESQATKDFVDRVNPLAGRVPCGWVSLRLHQRFYQSSR